jgi:signal transduction histidine kinase/ActR/RegA family two-component response regulator
MDAQPPATKFNVKGTSTVLVIFVLSVGGVLLVLLTLAGFRELRITPLHIDIRAYPLYVKSGFDPADLSRPDFSAKGWKLIEPTVENQNSVIRIKNQGFKEIPHRNFFSPLKKKDQEFTVCIPFHLDDAKYAFYMDTESSRTSLPIPGMYLASIGENLEIFLNGTTIRKELYLDDEGQITSHRAWRKVSFPVARSLFKKGDNLLTMRIVGDPTNATTGFFYASPYYIDEYTSMVRHHSELLIVALCGVYSFVGLYHLLLFLLLPREASNLWLSLFAICMGIYNLSRTTMAYYYIPDTDILRRIEFGICFILPPTMSAFFEYLYFRKLKPPVIIYGTFCILLALGQGVFSLQFGEDALWIWNISVLLYLPVAFAHDIIYPFIVSCRTQWEVNKATDPRSPLCNAIVSVIFDTSLGNMMIIVLLIIFSTIHDIIQILFIRQGHFLLIYSFFVFTLGGAFILARKFGDLYSLLNQAITNLADVNANLEETVHERTKELEVQTNLAETASQAKSEFLAHMSHEIRTPLNAILGFADVELNKHPRGETGENLERIYDSGSILLGIINDLLDISKIETGHFELTLVEYSPLSLLNDVLNLNRVRLGSKPIELELEIDETMPAMLYGDELRVKQILNNLLSNAIKYTDHGTITFNARWKEKNNDTITIAYAVRDTGRGIRQEDLADLFSEYTRLDQLSNRNIEGTGLGLAITKKLTEMMGGAIIVESEYGKGSTFSASIVQKLVDATPVGKEAAENLKYFSHRPERRELAKKLVRVQIPNTYVLVVDDVVSNLMVAKGLLDPYGLNVYMVKSGQQAIDLIRKGKIHFDLIFMDQMMPEMDGLEAVRIIRNEIDLDYIKTVPIIALTANALKGSDVMFLEHGFQDFLSKPIDILQLDEMLHKWVVR